MSADNLPARVLSDEDIEKIMSGKPLATDLVQSGIEVPDDAITPESSMLDPDSLQEESDDIPPWQQGPEEREVLVRGMKSLPEDISLERIWETTNLLTVIYHQQDRYEKLRAAFHEMQENTGMLGMNAKKYRVLAYIEVWKNTDPEFYKLLAGKIMETDERLSAE